MSKLFGFNIKKSVEDQKIDTLESFAPPSNDDGAMVVAAGGAYGTYVDLDGAIKTEADLISKYREMSLTSEIDAAIDDIVNESIVCQDGDNSVDINLDELTSLDEQIKLTIKSEFENILSLLEFKDRAYEIFRRYYIDGRLYYHVIIDNDNILDGIKELRYIDPRKIKKVKELSKKKNKQTSDILQSKTAEYYVYSDKGLNSRQTSYNYSSQSSTALKIAEGSILYITSGLTDSSEKMVLSHLHKAIRPLNQMRNLEDAVIIYRISRAAERRIFYIDVGNLPKGKAEQYLRDMMARHKNKLVYNAESGDIQDTRKFMCYSLDTKIPLLDGRTLTLQEIINEYKNGKLNWVYSCDPITGKFVPGPISWAGITKHNAQVVKVTFDNGKSVICTPDHKFPVWNKGFIEAKDLVGESIIPGYRRMEKLYNSSHMYEQIYKNDTKKWEFTHRIVAKWKDENNIREEMIHLDQYINESKNTIHHKDFNRFNNSPSNLVRMNKDDHLKYHWNCAKFGGIGNRRNKKEDFTIEWKSKLSKAASSRIPHCKTWKIITPNDEIIIIENLSKYCRNNNLNRSNIKKSCGSKKYHAELLYNHKAISVEWLDNNIDVGCITIDLEESYHSYHTYLLDAGVYTKNTMLEDYWFPRREGGKGTEVTTLSAAQNLGEMEDVKYFQQKVYKALNVPVTRLEPEMSFNLGRATEITRDEIKFSLFIDRLRLKFSNIFTKVLEKQLILKNIITPEDWKYIERKIRYKYKTNNYFSELKDSEILGERLNRMEQLKSYIGRYYSNDEVRRKVLRQTDDDIMRNDEKIAEEQQNPQFEFPLDSNLFNMEMQEKQMEMQQQQNEAEQQAAQQESAQNNQNDGSWDFEDSAPTKKSRSK